MNTYEKKSFHEFAMVLEGKQTCFFKEDSSRCPPVIIFDSKSIAMFDGSEKFDIN
jgi:hypothetical protein